jgi:putative mRNA 3-end processing factor
VTRRERVEWTSGVRVTTKETRIALDPVRSGGLERGVHRFISHAHADHTQGLSGHGTKYATMPTRMIYENLRKKQVKDFKELRIRHPIRLDDVEVTPIDAGHMLGSIQFKITTPNKTLLYTGDLNYTDTLTTHRAESVECDILLIEATFGSPFYVFPDRESTYARIVEWSTDQAKEGRVPTFHVYAAGKAQEIVRLFNIYTELPVVVSPSISAANEAYSRNGVTLRYKTLDTESNLDFDDEPFVYLTTPSDRLVPDRSERATATGWALRNGSGRFPSFPLSSHADFKQLVEFVLSTKAEKVYIFTGYADPFASYLQKRFGIDARPVPQVVQKSLFEFGL